VVWLITAFEVPPDADEAFIAAWERARDSLSKTDRASATALYRTLRPDAEFRFVNVAPVESRKAWREAIGDAELPGGAMPFKAHSGLFDVAHEDGAPEGAGGAILINPFEVPAGDDERFLTAWDGARQLLATQRGYLGTRLQRSLAAARFRFVDIVRWSSPLAYSKAIRRPEFQHAAAALPFPSHPSLYQVIRD
jgi:heme-degrading monooxygenase HmoA